jgi:uncharacterized protein YdeI (YjbR/CyaY-like superfamily)
MDPKPGEPVEPFADVEAFDRWLAAHHDSERVVWIRYAKKSTGIPSITWTEAVDVALCYGWIDGQSKSIDERSHVQRFTPRGPRSRWSKVNCERIPRLIAEGRMRPSGLAEVERARADGRWEAAYDSPRNAVVPEDLAAALDADPKARAFFERLDGANRYAVLYRVQEAKRPETRARRIATLVAVLGREEKLH